MPCTNMDRAECAANAMPIFIMPATLFISKVLKENQLLIIISNQERFGNISNNWNLYAEAFHFF